MLEDYSHDQGEDSDADSFFMVSFWPFETLNASFRNMMASIVASTSILKLWSGYTKKFSVLIHWYSAVMNNTVDVRITELQKII